MWNKVEFTQDQKNEILSHHKNGMSCKDIGKLFNVGPKPITRILKTEFGCSMFKERPKVGDVVKGWKILEIYNKRFANQSITMARIITTLEGDKSEREVPLTRLTNGQIGRSDNYRNDNILRNTTHGKSKTRIYRIWASMKERCLNKKTAIKSGYAKLGIQVCEDWKSFEVFEKWALENGYSDLLSLDRIDPMGNYCPENCRWASWEIQSRNKVSGFKKDLTIFGETKCIQEWANDPRCVVIYPTLKRRILSDWEPEKALTQEPERPRKLNLKNWLKINYKDIYEEYLYNYDMAKDGTINKNL